MAVRIYLFFFPRRRKILCTNLTLRVAKASSVFVSLRVGKVYSIKMLLELQCAFVNYTRKEDCERAIQCIDVRICLLRVVVVRCGADVSRLEASRHQEDPGLGVFYLIFRLS